MYYDMMTKRRDKEVAVLISSSTHREFQKLCIDDGTNMSAVLRKAIQDYIKTHRERPGPKVFVD